MMTTTDIYICILGMAISTYLIRISPFMFLGNREMPKKFQIWLKYVPSSVFGALIFSGIFQTDNGLDFSLNNINILAAVPVFVVAAKTKSLPYSIITGLVSYAVLQQCV